ncbi:UNKNOWN [Stylonychia lemnae]|uniref:Uncharacterized protein n=1 Tax=Stylonychia lemnae TaxID=5949 RepID=A0A078AXG1_STYLE|nr:UNKNOWN [Stylonychia lemnae]|eukprot:CDW86761.1 UNKNOWN [Stylonychia lemnae]
MTQQILSNEKIDLKIKRQSEVKPYNISITKKYINKDSVQSALLGQKRYEDFLKADEKEKYELYKDNLEKSKQNLLAGVSPYPRTKKQ